MSFELCGQTFELLEISHDEGLPLYKASDDEEIGEIARNMVNLAYYHRSPIGLWGNSGIIVDPSDTVETACEKLKIVEVNRILSEISEMRRNMSNSKLVYSVTTGEAPQDFREEEYDVRCVSGHHAWVVIPGDWLWDDCNEHAGRGTADVYTVSHDECDSCVAEEDVRSFFNRLADLEFSVGELDRRSGLYPRSENPNYMDGWNSADVLIMSQFSTQHQMVQIEEEVTVSASSVLVYQTSTEEDPYVGKSVPELDLWTEEDTLTSAGYDTHIAYGY